jgi:hypothetical protein
MGQEREEMKDKQMKKKKEKDNKELKVEKNGETRREQ